MKKPSLFSILALAATIPLLAACGTSCNCPRCAGTTVVTPDAYNGQTTTIVRPNAYNGQTTTTIVRPDTYNDQGTTIVRPNESVASPAQTQIDNY